METMIQSLTVFVAGVQEARNETPSDHPTPAHLALR
jgi:hypothetical protein